MKNIKILSFLLIFLLQCLGAEETLVLGEEDNWQEAYLYNLTRQDGQKGFIDLQVAQRENPLKEDTDLLLGFNQPRPVDQAMHYRISGSAEIQEQFTRRGKGAVLFRGDTPMELYPMEKALFYPGEEWGDFTLQFWLYPTNLREGEILLQWKGFIQGQQRVMAQQIVCRISNRRLNWDFENFFLDPRHEKSSFQLEGDQLIPRKWSHHMIRFHQETGLLEYLVDGKPSSVIHTTPTGHENIQVLYPTIDQMNPTPLIIGSSFSGFMDELSISRNWIENPYLLAYEKPGYYLSPIQDLNYQDSSVLSLEVNQQVRGNSRMEYYYYISNQRDDVRDQWIQLTGRDHPEKYMDSWQSFSPGDLNPPPQGRYLIVAVLLYPDVGEESSPVLSSIAIAYEEHLPPIPPLNLRAYTQDGKVYLHWDYSENSAISGFLIYYGDRPGQYLGSASPIRVDQLQQDFVLDNLEAYKTWYISMVSVNDSSPPQYSDFSQEVAVRP